MALDLRSHCVFLGPALPDPFVELELENELNKLHLLPSATGQAGRDLQESWDIYRRKIRDIGSGSGSIRVGNQILAPLVDRLGYAKLSSVGPVPTREEPRDGEAGGMLFVSADGKSQLRAWPVDESIDLEAPSRRGAAYRYSHLRIAQRVLLASGERVGLLTNGVQLRILIADPVRPDSQVILNLDPGWRRSRTVPDSYRLLVALCSPEGTAELPNLVDRARLMQTRVTRELRVQARQAVIGFVQGVLDHPDNHERLARMGKAAEYPVPGAQVPAQDLGLEHSHTPVLPHSQTPILPHAHTSEDLARALWHEGLVLVYRLLFILKMESSSDPSRAFSFASTTLWRNTFSPSTALARYARDILDKGTHTGTLLESGLRSLFRLFVEGISCSELKVHPLGGALFGDRAAPLLTELAWGEQAAAHLLDQLLWTSGQRAGDARRRVHYGPLDVEDLGRVYEALLELEPGIASGRMCRLRRQKLELVVPLAQGEPYRKNGAGPAVADAPDSSDEDAADETEEDDETGTRAQKTRVEWIEEIHPGQFYLRVGLGRKASGSHYTPHSFVRFLVQETLGPQAAKRSPPENPNPLEILKLKVLDPTMGSGHLLVETCRFLGDRLYEAVRTCDVKALAADRDSETATTDEARAKAATRAWEWREKLRALPDSDDELLAYLPSRAPEGSESGYSHARARAICRRLVAVNCLYGVDKNPLAVELARLALWLESQAEGYPLTFLDHRLVVGDSLTGPFWEHLTKRPGTQQPISDLFAQGLEQGFLAALGKAIESAKWLQADVGATLQELEVKTVKKQQMDRALAPFRVLAAAWAGGVMLGKDGSDDDAYQELARTVASTGGLPETLSACPALREMLGRGLGIEPDEVPLDSVSLYLLIETGPCIPALPYQLTFPEVFFPAGVFVTGGGFDTVLGNPPWDAIQFKTKEFLAAFDISILDASTNRAGKAIEERVLAHPPTRRLFDAGQRAFEEFKRSNDVYYSFQKIYIGGDLAGRYLDTFRVSMERSAQLARTGGLIGLVVPSAFHGNEGATGVRRLYLEQMALQCCYSFENRRKLFEIDSRFKFAVAVARKAGTTDRFRCAFYLHDDAWLFSPDERRLEYSLDFVRRTGGEYLSLLELRTAADLAIAETCFDRGEPLGKICQRLGIRLGQELNMTLDAWRFTLSSKALPLEEDPRDPDVAQRLLDMGYLVLHEGKTFHQFTDRWAERPRYVVALSAVTDRPQCASRSASFRLAYRAIARSTDERTGIFTVLPPGITGGHSAGLEQEPEGRRLSSVLELVGCVNSFTSDWCLRQTVAANVTQHILLAIPVPSTLPQRFTPHLSLRLTCNHAGYEPLWREQVGSEWREKTPPFTWPVLSSDDERWEVRAAIDAVVADAYGLERAQYAHVLSGFSHKSYPEAPELCLAQFDDLKQIGLEAFTRKHDPYWDIPLNESLPKPVIELPGAGGDGGVAAAGGEVQMNLFGDVMATDLFGEPIPQRRGRKRGKR